MWQEEDQMFLQWAADENLEEILEQRREGIALKADVTADKSESELCINKTCRDFHDT